MSENDKSKIDRQLDREIFWLEIEERFWWVPSVIIGILTGLAVNFFLDLFLDIRGDIKAIRAEQDAKE